MALFCPMSNDWGTWADMANVVVAGVATLAVWRLTTRANSVAEGSSELAKQLASQAEQQREREADFLLAYLYPEVLQAASRMEHFVQTLDLTPEGRFASDVRVRRAMREKLAKIELPLCAEQMERMHVLDESTGGALARVLGTLPLMRQALANTMTDVPVSDVDNLTMWRATRLHGKRSEKDLKNVVAACQKARSRYR